MSKLTFRNPKTKQTQEVGENETIKIATLKRLGWQQVGQELQTGEQQPLPQTTPVKPTLPDGKSTMPEKLSPVGQVPAKNVSQAESHQPAQPKRKRRYSEDE